MSIPQEHDDQYKMLRDEVMKLVEESRKVETHTVTAVAILFGWFLTHQKEAHLPEWAWFIPAGVAILGCIRSVALFKRVGLIASYLRRIEEQYLTEIPSLPGYERFYEPKGGGNPISFSAFLFWVALILASIIAPLCAS